MTIISLLTISQVVAMWTGVFMTLVTIAASLWLANRGRELLRQFLLDAIQVYAAFMQARIDANHERTKLRLHEGEARLLLRDQRRQLLASMERE